jgi:dihydroflavonol-4-reductase
MNLLITGVTGFVGRNILVHALKSGRYHRIFLPVRNIKKFEMQLAAEGYDRIPEVLSVFEGDTNQWNLSAEARRAEHVIHSAGVIFAHRWPEYQQTNVTGTRSLFELLENPERIVVLSSLSAAGPSASTGEPHREGGPDRPVTFYGKSKLQMEDMLKTHFASFPYVCLRPPMIFGPRDHATLPLFKMIKKKVHFKPSFSDKNYTVLAVGDLVEAIFKILDFPIAWPRNPNRYYYIGNPAVITDRDILRTAAKVVGSWGVILPVPQVLLKIASRLVSSIPTWRTTIPSLSVDRAREIWPQRWLIDSSLLSTDFRWTAKTSFEDSVRQTYEWYQRFGLVPTSQPRLVLSENQ